MATWAVVLIKVRNGRAISIEPLGEPNPLAKFSTYESFDTVEKMFNEIQEAYDREFVVEVSYDKEYGYPEKMTLNNLAVFDGSIILDISKFEVVGQDIN